MQPPAPILTLKLRARLSIHCLNPQCPALQVNVIGDGEFAPGTYITSDFGTPARITTPNVKSPDCDSIFHIVDEFLVGWPPSALALAPLSPLVAWPLSMPACLPALLCHAGLLRLPCPEYLLPAMSHLTGTAPTHSHPPISPAWCYSGVTVLCSAVQLANATGPALGISWA